MRSNQTGIIYIDICLDLGKELINTIVSQIIEDAHDLSFDDAKGIIEQVYAEEHFL